MAPRRTRAEEIQRAAGEVGRDASRPGGQTQTRPQSGGRGDQETFQSGGRLSAPGT